MPRSARIVVPHLPHHVIQRGNRRQTTFFGPDDYRDYLRQLDRFARRYDTKIWAYCLMPNHVHLIVVPSTVEGLSKTVGTAHWHYSNHINRREHWSGMLWQGRFGSFPMHTRYLVAATRYVLLNPVRSGLVRDPADWPYSSLGALLDGAPNPYVDCSVLHELVSDWSALVYQPLDEMLQMTFKKHQETNLPLGLPKGGRAL